MIWKQFEHLHAHGLENLEEMGNTLHTYELQKLNENNINNLHRPIQAMRLKQ
jgi:hypothetical protein